MRKAEAASPGFPSAKSMRSFISFMRAASFPWRLAEIGARLLQKRRSIRIRCQSDCGDTSSQACSILETGEAVLWTINCLEGGSFILSHGQQESSRVLRWCRKRQEPYGPNREYRLESLSGP